MSAASDDFQSDEAKECVRAYYVLGVTRMTSVWEHGSCDFSFTPLAGEFDRLAVLILGDQGALT